MVEAMETYKRVLSIDRANVASMCNLAILEQRVCRNFPAAERYFMQCLECDPYHCTALANYASLKMEQRDSASAHRLYLRYPERSGRARKWGTAVSSREAFSSATVGLACLLPHIDIPRNTKRRCLAVDGQNVASLMGLALLLRVVSSPHSLLVNDFTICISIRMSWPSLYVMVFDCVRALFGKRCGALQRQDKDREAALAYCREALGIHPDSIWLQNLEV